jgi:hypothetical protein
MEPVQSTKDETAQHDKAESTPAASASQDSSQESADGARSRASGQRRGESDTGGTRQGPDTSSRDCSRPDEAAAEKTDLEDQWYELSFSIARSLRYHAKRRAFFERCNQLTRALSAIFGAATVAAVIKGVPWITATMGAAVGISTALDLVFDFSRRAMLFDDLYRRFADLSVEIVSCDPSPENVRRIMIKRLLIEKEEPTLLSILNVLCSNEERIARGYPDVYKLGFWQKRLCQFWDIGPFKFELISTMNLSG